MSGLRQPRFRLTVDNAEVPGLIGADVFASSQLSADRFRARFASQLAMQSLERLATPGARLALEGAADLRGGETHWTRLLVGQIDQLSLDPVRGVVEAEGRDLAAQFIEGQAGEVFANQTASEIVQAIAGKHGIAADVVETATPVGRYYQDQHERLTLAQQSKAITEWDLLTWLAGQEGYLLRMLGDRLQFGPREAEAIPVQVSDCISCEASLQVGLLRPIEVTVRSWGTRAGQLVSQRARSDGVGPLLTQVIARPNLSADQALALAQRVLADMRIHARSLRLVMPGELTIRVSGALALSGVGAGWDGVYGIASLDRHFDPTHGFTQAVELQSLGADHG